MSLIPSKKRGLGRGLDALLGGSNTAAEAQAGSTGQLPVDLIQRGRYQPRRDFDETALKELEQQNSKTYLEIMKAIIEETFGTHSTYCDILTQASFPNSGDGSLQSRAWQGMLAGNILMGALQTEATLESVAESLNQTLIKMPLEERKELSCPSADNLIKNYWAPFKPVAHLWLAMSSFTLPEEFDGVVRIDKAIKNETLKGGRDGWKGIVDYAEIILQKAAGIQRKQTHKKLLDPEKSFRLKLI